MAKRFVQQHGTGRKIPVETDPQLKAVIGKNVYLPDGQTLLDLNDLIASTTTNVTLSTGTTTPAAVQKNISKAQSKVLGRLPNPNATTKNIPFSLPAIIKGDLMVSTGTMVVRLPVGADTYVLTADSSKPEGTKWAPAAAGGGGNYTLIADVITSGSQTTVSFSSIPNTYKHLQVVCQCADQSTSVLEALVWLLLNGDTTAANYTNSAYAGSQNGTIQAGTVPPSVLGFVVSGGSGRQSNSSAVSMFVLTIPNYANTTFFKNFQSQYSDYYGGGDAIDTGIISGLWKSTAAINALLFTTGGTGFVNGSKFSLYGLS